MFLRVVFFYTFALRGAEMTVKKIRYLLAERGRYYYQRKVPKSVDTRVEDGSLASPCW